MVKSESQRVKESQRKSVHSFVYPFICLFVQIFVHLVNKTLFEKVQLAQNGVRLTENPEGRSGTVAQGATPCTWLTLPEPVLTHWHTLWPLPGGLSFPFTTSLQQGRRDK